MCLIACVVSEQHKSWHHTWFLRQFHSFSLFEGGHLIKGLLVPGILKPTEVDTLAVDHDIRQLLCQLQRLCFLFWICVIIKKKNIYIKRNKTFFLSMVTYVHKKESTEISLHWTSFPGLLRHLHHLLPLLRFLPLLFWTLKTCPQVFLVFSLWLWTGLWAPR